MPNDSFTLPRTLSIFELMKIVASSDIEHQNVTSPAMFSNRLRPENSSHPLLISILQLAIDIKQNGYQVEKDPITLLIETINIDRLPKKANTFEAILFKKLYFTFYAVSALLEDDYNIEEIYCLLRHNWEDSKTDMIQYLKTISETQDWQEELGIKYAKYDHLAFFSQYITKDQVLFFADVFNLEIYDARIESERCKILANMFSSKAEELPKMVENLDDQRILAIYNIYESCQQDIDLGNDLFFKFVPISLDMIGYCEAYFSIAGCHTKNAKKMSF